MTNNLIKEAIKEARNKIFYQVLAWFEDEGEYQPTEEEAQKKADKIISSLISKLSDEARAEERKKLIKWTEKQKMGARDITIWASELLSKLKK